MTRIEGRKSERRSGMSRQWQLCVHAHLEQAAI